MLRTHQWFYLLIGLAGLAALMFTHHALAQGTTATSEKSEVIQTQLTSSYVWIRLDPAITTDKYSCVNAPPTWNGFFRTTLVGDYKLKMSVAITALALGKKVAIKSLSCVGPYPGIDDIYIYSD